MTSPRRVAALEEIPMDGTLLVTLERGIDGPRREVILTRRSGDRVVAFENRCQHWRDVRLDRGDGARMRNGEIICAKHGAMFQVDTGDCVHGPCLGASLTRVPVTIENGCVHLVEEEWSVVGRGALEDRARSDGDTRGGVDF